MNSDVLKEPIVISIAEKLGKTPAQVALHWNLQMGHSVLPKSVSEERIKQNIDVYDWSIPDDLLAKFSEIKQVSYTTYFRQHLLSMLLAVLCLNRLFLSIQKLLYIIGIKLH